MKLAIKCHIHSDTTKIGLPLQLNQVRSHMEKIKKGLSNALTTSWASHQKNKAFGQHGNGPYKETKTKKVDQASVLSQTNTIAQIVFRSHQNILLICARA